MAGSQGITPLKGVRDKTPVRDLTPIKVQMMTKQRRRVVWSPTIALLTEKRATKPMPQQRMLILWVSLLRPVKSHRCRSIHGQPTTTETLVSGQDKESLHCHTRHLSLLHGHQWSERPAGKKTFTETKAILVKHDGWHTRRRRVSWLCGRRTKSIWAGISHKPGRKERGKNQGHPGERPRANEVNEGCWGSNGLRRALSSRILTNGAVGFVDRQLLFSLPLFLTPKSMHRRCQLSRLTWSRTMDVEWLRWQSRAVLVQTCLVLLLGPVTVLSTVVLFSYFRGGFPSGVLRQRAGSRVCSLSEARSSRGRKGVERMP